MEPTDKQHEFEVESVPGVVGVAAIRAKDDVFQATIAIKPNLWHNWARIAMRAESRAIVARHDGLVTEGDVAPFIESETLETMIAVVGVRQSFHHLYLEWQETLGLDEERHVPQLATTDVPLTDADLRIWLGKLAEVVDDRNEIIHVPQESLPVVPHPLGTNTSVFDAHFTMERATRAVDLMLDFYKRVLTSPSEALEVWASKRQHVYGNFADLRAKYQRETT